MITEKEHKSSINFLFVKFVTIIHHVKVNMNDIYQLINIKDYKINDAGTILNKK